MFTPHSIRHPLKAAIAWQVISEIAKRHREPEDLRVVEMHPGGGQYGLLRLLRVNNPKGLIFDSANQIVADFNLATGQLSNPFTEATPKFSWLERWLVCDDIDDLMAAMQPVVGMDGIKHRLDDSRAVFGFTLIGQIEGLRSFTQAHKFWSNPCYLVMICWVKYPSRNDMWMLCYLLHS